MAQARPQYITREALEERLREETALLGGGDLAWWSEHRVEPFGVEGGGQTHYAVAVSGHHLLIFFDNEDEFGAGQLSEGACFGDGGLYGNLVDAVRGMRKLERERHV
jgi:hypothetical protein